MSAIVAQLKEKAGAQCRAEELFGVDKKSVKRIVLLFSLLLFFVLIGPLKGNVVHFDFTKTVAENGITPTHHPILRFPSAAAGKNFKP